MTTRNSNPGVLLAKQCDIVASFLGGKWPDVKGKLSSSPGRTHDRLTLDDSWTEDHAAAAAPTEKLMQRK
jgi:hypothetical protein